MIEPIIITETDEYWVINKPADMAVEPPSRQQTLQDWLLASNKIDPKNWAAEERFGVVHRLDTDTSGVLIWAKNQESQAKLKLLWQGRGVKKTYLALVVGKCPLNGTVELPLMRDNRNDRQTVAWLSDQRSRSAITEYERLAVGQVSNHAVSLVRARPITGRTHQIRVHLKAIGHPIIGDGLYGEKSSVEIANKINLSRQFLHASELCVSQQKCYQASLPEDLLKSLAAAGIDHVE